MEFIICWIDKVPNVIWSAIIASCLTFLGVMWTNKGNERRQIALLDHGKVKYQSEQKLALKKEVFYNVASSFAGVLELIPKLAKLEFSEKYIDAYSGLANRLIFRLFLSKRRGRRELTIPKAVDCRAINAEGEGCRRSLLRFAGKRKTRSCRLVLPQAAGCFKNQPEYLTSASN